MALGADYSQGYDIPSLKRTLGASFVCRYIGWTDPTLPQEKIITYSEAYDLIANEINIVSNWEWTADRASIHNTFYNGDKNAAFKGGIDDANLAEKLHMSIGGPVDRPIYFSIDYDTDGSDCVYYFGGLCSYLGVKRVGAYGPPFALKYLKSQGLLTWMWGWSQDPDMHIVQTGTDIKMGSMVLDTDISLTQDFGQWTIPGTLPKPKWFQYPVGVPPLNTGYDTGLGGSHDMTILCPPNMEVTSLVSGVVSDLSAPSWGKQIGVKLDSPFNGKPYYANLHLSALNPALTVGQRITIGDLFGWAGGANNTSQYLGTSNPTGQNFLNSPDMSSRVQVGIALMDGPSYGGAGWKNFPPLDLNLDPSKIVLWARIGEQPVPTPVPPSPTPFKQQQFDAVWKTTGHGIRWFGSGLYHARLQAMLLGKLASCYPIEDEQKTSMDGLAIIDWNGKPIIWQSYSDGSHGEWDIASGSPRIYDPVGNRVL